MSTFKRLWIWLRSSLWFIPALIVAASSLAAFLLVDTAGSTGTELAARWPRVFGASAEGSRQMLAAIATSMITVAGVVFSITIVALSLASTQYSPRVLRNFMRDWPTQVVLGVFVGNFVYCLLVLRTVRGGDDGTFIPSLAVLAGMAYAFTAMALLIYFIHHVAQSIQASAIVLRIFHDTSASIDHMFPAKLGTPARDTPASPPPVPAQWTPVRAEGNGYVTGVAGERLLRFALENDRVLRLKVAVGDFVMRGVVFIELSGHTPVTAAQAAALRKMLTLDRQRTTEQDPAFGIQQLVDVAVKALSPGINDPTTASMCVHQLGALTLQLSARRMPDAYRMADGHLRVIAPAPGYRQLVALAFGAIVQHSRGDVQVLCSVLDQIEVAEGCVADPQRRRTLAAVARAVGRELRQPQRNVGAALALRRARRMAGVLRARIGAQAVRCHPGAEPGESMKTDGLLAD